jgi:chlorophyll synthase
MGPDRAARFACFVMAMAQIAVIGFLLSLSRPMFAALIAGLLLAQLFLMRILLRDPRGKAPWYNATGTTLYVFGMLAAALAIAPLSGGLNG